MAELHDPEDEPECGEEFDFNYEKRDLSDANIREMVFQVVPARVCASSRDRLQPFTTHSLSYPLLCASMHALACMRKLEPMFALKGRMQEIKQYYNPMHGRQRPREAGGANRVETALGVGTPGGSRELPRGTYGSSSPSSFSSSEEAGKEENPGQSKKNATAGVTPHPRRKSAGRVEDDASEDDTSEEDADDDDKVEKTVAAKEKSRLTQASLRSRPLVDVLDVDISIDVEDVDIWFHDDDWREFDDDDLMMTSDKQADKDR